jgi:hypothetical protein
MVMMSQKLLQDFFIRKQKSLPQGQGGCGLVRSIGFHLLAARLVETATTAFDLALHTLCGIQLRDSAGLSPASLFCLPIRG